jgi:hypothetical protein
MLGPREATVGCRMLQSSQRAGHWHSRAAMILSTRGIGAGTKSSEQLSSESTASTLHARSSRRCSYLASSTHAHASSSESAREQPASQVIKSGLFLAQPSLPFPFPPVGSLFLTANQTPPPPSSDHRRCGRFTTGLQY